MDNDGTQPEATAPPGHWEEAPVDNDSMDWVPGPDSPVPFRVRFHRSEFLKLVQYRTQLGAAATDRAHHREMLDRKRLVFARWLRERGKLHEDVTEDST